MGLKDDIIVKQQFTVKDKITGRGTNGSTPGDYLTGYMARDDATETSNFILPNMSYEGYMVRESATESLDADTFRDFELTHKSASKSVKSIARKTYKDSKNKSTQPEKWYGVAFSNESLAVSKNELLDFRRQLQEGFDHYKTVFKTVLSFRTEYLQKYGIVPPDLVVTQKGDFRGKVDQVRLRCAIHDGLDAFGRDFDNFRYMGVIQIDTKHVHCHLVGCDFGEGKIIKDGLYAGQQRGKLSSEQMMRLRRHIDTALDQTRALTYMASNTAINERSLKISIAKDFYDNVTEYGVPQMLYALLPEDQTTWRANSNAKNMKAAHNVCHDYVDMILKKYPDKMQELQDNFDEYVETRRQREGLNKKQCKELRQKCSDNFYRDCENIIYKTLRQIPVQYRQQSTDFLSLATDEELVNSGQNDIQGFVYKLKAYTSRYHTHRRNVKKYDSYATEYEIAKNTTGVAEGSQVLYEFFQFERDYNLQLSSKYSQMLFFDDPDDELLERYMDIVKESEILTNLRLLRDDVDVKKYKTPETLNRYARDRYDIFIDVSMLRTDTQMYDEVILDPYENKYREDYNVFMRDLNARSKAIVVDEQTGEMRVVKHAAYNFDEIRGLDLQDVRYDFGKTLEFDGEVRMTFMNCAQRRLELYDKVCDYLKESNQEDSIQIFDVDDLRRMQDVYDKLKNNEPIINSDTDIMRIEIEHKTVVSVDANVSRRLFENMMSNITESYIESDAWKDDLD